MEDCQGLKMKSGDVADLTPHAGDDLPALGTTPFEGEEDDEGRSLEYPAYTPRSIRSGRSIWPVHTGVSGPRRTCPDRVVSSLV